MNLVETAAYFLACVPRRSNAGQPIQTVSDTTTAADAKLNGATLGQAARYVFFPLSIFHVTLQRRVNLLV